MVQRLIDSHTKSKLEEISPDLKAILRAEASVTTLLISQISSLMGLSRWPRSQSFSKLSTKRSCPSGPIVAAQHRPVLSFVICHILQDPCGIFGLLALTCPERNRQRVSTPDARGDHWSCARSRAKRCPSGWPLCPTPGDGDDLFLPRTHGSDGVSRAREVQA